MKILVTGASGYVARTLLPYLLDDDEITSVRGLDVRPPGIEHPKFSFIQEDVRSDGVECAAAGADVVAHLAFIVGEIKDKKKIHDINVNGTRRVLDAVKSTGVRRLVLASSICAYGSHRRSDVITEDTPLRGNAESYYAHTKRIAETMLDEFEKENPEVVVTRLRPSVLCGANNDNFFLDLLTASVIPYASSNPDGLPLVHEDDVGQAFHIAIKSGVPGAFNIAAGNLSYAKIGQIAGKRIVGIPYFLLKPLSDIGYMLGTLPVSSQWAVLSRHPFDLSCEKAKQQLGWAPRRTPEQAFREMVAAWKKK